MTHLSVIPKTVAIIAKKAKQHGIKLIYETDDDFLDMNSSNPSFNYIQGNLANIKKRCV